MITGEIAVDKKEQLWELCQNFIKQQQITCAETVGQSDHVIENAYGFIEDICDIVGYLPYEDTFLSK